MQTYLVKTPKFDYVVEKVEYGKKIASLHSNGYFGEDIVVYRVLHYRPIDNGSWREYGTKAADLITFKDKDVTEMTKIQRQEPVEKDNSLPDGWEFPK